MCGIGRQEATSLGKSMIKTLMEISDVVMERVGKNGWEFSYSGFRGVYHPHDEQTGMLFIEFERFFPSFNKLIDLWQCQFSRGEFAANIGLVFWDKRWWLAQYLVGKEMLITGAELQIQLAACLLVLSKRESMKAFPAE